MQPDQPDRYYERKNVVHLDGTRVFHSQADIAAERLVANEIGDLWGCSINGFGSLSPVDWYAERFGRLVGVLELKARNHAHDHYPTVFLNVRKWLALLLASAGLGCPAIFVVKFTDSIRWIKVADIDASRTIIGGVGRARAVASVNDVEPIIEVPVTAMSVLKKAVAS